MDHVLVLLMMSVIDPKLFNYSLTGQVLEKVMDAKYLGVTLSNDLEWSKHIATMTKLVRVLNYYPRKIYVFNLIISKKKAEKTLNMGVGCDKLFEAISAMVDDAATSVCKRHRKIIKKGTTDAIFIMRQVQEKHQAKKKKLYYAFVDLEKAFDRVPREVVRWALRKLGVDEWLIRTVMALYTEACTIVRTDAGLSEILR